MIRFIRRDGIAIGDVRGYSFWIGHTTLSQQRKLKPLHIALANNSVSMTAIYVAKHLGIFESYGYDARVLVLEPRAVWRVAIRRFGFLLRHRFDGAGGVARRAGSGRRGRIQSIRLHPGRQ